VSDQHQHHSCLASPPFHDMPDQTYCLSDPICLSCIPYFASSLPSAFSFSLFIFLFQQYLMKSECSKFLSPMCSGIGLNHFSIVLSNKEEFQRLADQLSSSGNTLTALSERSGFIYDMDGIKIQMQYD
jgi:hypothetical protein